MDVLMDCEWNGSGSFSFETGVDDDGYPVVLPSVEEFSIVPFFPDSITGVAISIPNADIMEPRKDSIFKTFMLFMNIFHNYHSGRLGTEHEIEGLLISIIREQFSLFMKVLSHHKNEGHDYQAFVWISTAQRLIWLSFLNNRLIEDRMKNLRGTANLLDICFEELNRLHSTQLESNPRFGYVKDVVLYNFWGEDYEKKAKTIDRSIPLLDEEKEICQLEENKKKFYNHIYKSLAEISILSSDDMVAEKPAGLSDFIHRLLRDYFFRVREVASDLEVVLFAIRYWKYSTNDIIYRAYVLFSGKLVVSLAKHNTGVLKMTEDGDGLYIHEKQARLSFEAYKKLLELCDEYESRLSTKGLVPQWSEKIRSLVIDYEGLCKDLKSFFEMVLFITKEELEVSIEMADFSALYKLAEKKGKRSGYIGAVQYMISELGDNINKQWLLKAVESIPNTTQKDPVAAIRSNAYPTDKMKKMHEILRNNIKHFRRRERRDRSK